MPVGRPNTVFLFEATASQSVPLPPMLLCPAGWAKLLALYPDPSFTRNLCRIARYGAKVGYEGPAQAIRRPNLVSAREAPDIIDADLRLKLQKGRVAEIQVLGTEFIISPLGLVPKPAGGYRRIHHLSAPPKH